MQTQNTKSWNIHVDTHTQKSEILANTQLRTASRIHVVVKSLQLPPLFSSFALAVSLLVKSWKESFQASFMQKRGILIMRFLNKNFNSFIEICLTYKAVHMISIWGKVSKRKALTESCCWSWPWIWWIKQTRKQDQSWGAGDKAASQAEEQGRAKRNFSQTSTFSRWWTQGRSLTSACRQRAAPLGWLPEPWVWGE